MSRRAFEMLDVIVSIIVVALMIQPTGRAIKTKIALFIAMIYGIYRTSVPND
tara:strand:+ start:746 stop:901 length:156 start_codon:yes stop_codon:yes gene_type:complete